MIINHKYKFIFIKTRKTAGTSIEIALSQFCDANDIITPINKNDERKRQELGFRGPQNYNIPFHYYKRSDWVNLLRNGERKKYVNHAEARFIRNNIEEDIWRSYFKFCFEREPFDKSISVYYWYTRGYTDEPRPDISDYLDSVRYKLLSNWDIYTMNDQIAVDFVGRYENLTDDLAVISDKLGLPGEINLPRAKGNYRKNREHYSTLLDAKARARVELVCAKEMCAFNYRWHNS